MKSLALGEYLVHLARDSIANSFDKRAIRQSRDKGLLEKRGVFVTLHLDNELRGCIGFPEPLYPLQEAVIRAAKAAAFQDPRFPPLTREELERVSVEVSVLTVPEPVSSLPDGIVLGRDGLCIDYMRRNGLLLPQVAIDLRWTKEEFLDNLCRKAGLPPKSWCKEGCLIRAFRAQIFAEESGRVVELTWHRT